MIDLNQMFFFVRVAQAGGFSAASRQLGVPKSTLSRKISDLEERLGARLLQRTTRKLGLTDAGRVYFDQAARIVADAQIAEQAVGHLQASPRGLLRVTAPLSFAMLAPIVTEYLRKYRNVQVDLVCSDRTFNLVEDGFDVAIRAGALADSTLVARSLGGLKRVLVAAPRYCKDHGIPKEPADLTKHTCITFAAGATPNIWVLESAKQRTEVRVLPRFAANDLEIMRAAAIDGIGVAWMPGFLCVDDIRQRRLRHLLPEWRSAETPLHAVYPTARHLSPKVAAFIELVRSRLRLDI
jgi:DNA-binding transcriptional LysR family regulator